MLFIDEFEQDHPTVIETSNERYLLFIDEYFQRVRTRSSDMIVATSNEHYLLFIDENLLPEQHVNLLVLTENSHEVIIG